MPQASHEDKSKHPHYCNNNNLTFNSYRDEETMSPMALPHLRDAPLMNPHTPDFDTLKLPKVHFTEVASSPTPLPTLEPTPCLASTLSVSNERDPFTKSYYADNTHSAVMPPPFQLPSRVSTDSSSPTDAGSVYDDYLRRRDTNTTVDESDDRLAAEALCGLGQVDSDRSHDSRTQQEQDSLLSLLSSRHPWLGGTINNSISAYSSIKQYTPRPVQYGATLVESTVGHIGRGTGVEGNIRRYLGANHRSDSIEQEMPTKRRRTDETLHELSPHTLYPSIPQESSRQILEEPVHNQVVAENTHPRPVFRPTAHRSWSAQLLISTSGLGAAFNEASLRSLRCCLNVLRSTNAHINSLVQTLKRLLDNFEHPERYRNQLNPDPGGPPTNEQQANNANDTYLHERIKQLNNEIWESVKSVCANISRYTGGALPEVASAYVREQLMSVPVRWQRTASVSQQSAHSDVRSEAVSSGQRMVAFANEGLDMIDQVHDVVDDTIKSAEKWIERVGRRNYVQDHQQLEHGIDSMRLSRALNNGEQTLPAPLSTREHER